MPGFGVWLGRYLEALRVKNYSERTVEKRDVYLRFFIQWCEERSLMRPREVTKPILERYQRHLFHLRKDNGKPLSFRSQHSRLVPIRAFFEWLTRQNVLLSNPASELELPRLERRLPRHVLTAEEAEQVLLQPDLSDAMGLRDRAILKVLYSTGIRRMEVANLSVWDLDQERGTLMVRRGKGKKDRMVPIAERAIAWIERYLQQVRPSLVMPPDEGILFLTNLGESITPSRRTQLVREYVNGAELEKHGACHLFRHTMATLMLEGGADIRYIQEMLGHVELSTTQIYTLVSIRKLEAVHELTHPGAAKDKTAGHGHVERREVETERAAGPADEAAAEQLLLALDADSEEEEDDGVPEQQRLGRRGASGSLRPGCVGVRRTTRPGTAEPARALQARPSGGPCRPVGIHPAIGRPPSGP